ncbi:hypothetical protein SAMN04487963_3690 [Marinobacter zhejiangensis]|uniref:Polar amino acid transport system substrate-binding protein n=1 Tax=Marinobacter zhejiangensis TaxID=488535 RepID=A0A1I4TNL9_9GAMM|nr:hypothetical protein SAMN04487963_3690 [Marinobacter zhejiangensis]
MPSDRWGAPHWARCVSLAFTLLYAPVQALGQSSEPRPDNVRLITSPSTSEEPSVIAGQAVVREVYARCGLQVEYLNAPAARAVYMAENGQSDGELARIPMAVTSGAPLIPLEPPLEELHLVPLYLNPELPSDHRILSGNRVGYINGYRMVDSILPPEVIQVPTTSTAKLVQLLELNRIDVALALHWDAISAVHKNPKLLIGEHLITAPLYHYIHSSHEQDQPCLSEQLSAIKQSGEFEDIVAKILARPFPENSAPQQVAPQPDTLPEAALPGN